MKKKVLVCGATGFIGRNIAESLSQRDDFQVFGTYFRSQPYSNPKIEMIRADLTQASEVERCTQGMDIIIQAAATTSGSKDIVTKPYIHVTDNAVMNSLIFRSAFENKVKHVVFFSCTVMYPSSDTPLKETDFDANAGIFPKYFGVGWTKVYLEKMAEFYASLGGTKYTIARHSNIYGPYDKYDLERSHVFGATVTKIMTSASGKITVWGTGEEARDLLYVSDLTSFVEKSLDQQKDPFQLLNVGYGSAISIRDLVIKINAMSGKNLKIEYDTSKPTIPTSLSLDTTQAKEAFGWQPQVTLEEGITKTLQWYREHKPSV